MWNTLIMMLANYSPPPDWLRPWWVPPTGTPSAVDQPLGWPFYRVPYCSLLSKFLRNFVGIDLHLIDKYW